MYSTCTVSTQIAVWLISFVALINRYQFILGWQFQPCPMLCSIASWHIEKKTIHDSREDPLRLRSHRHAVPARTYRRQVATVAGRELPQWLQTAAIIEVHLVTPDRSIYCRSPVSASATVWRRLVERTCACAWLSPCQTTRRVQFHGELSNWHLRHVSCGNDVGTIGTHSSMKLAYEINSAGAGYFEHCGSSSRW